MAKLLVFKITFSLAILLATLSFQSFRPDFKRSATIIAQEDSVIYFNLATCKYKKYDDHRYSFIASKVIYSWGFHIECGGCMLGGTTISFFGDDNTVNTKTYDLPREISYKQFKHTKFISLDRLIDYLKKHENLKYARLYMVENVNSKYYRYHVQLQGGWNEE